MRSSYGRAPHRRRQLLGFLAGALAITLVFGGLAAVRVQQQHAAERRSGAFVAASGPVFTQRAVDIEVTPSDEGYWITSADGGVFTYGDAPFHGSAGGWNLAGSILDMAVRPDTAGYWLVGADGGVFAFGAAPFLGSLAPVPLNGPAVGIESTPTGEGYWVVAADGGVFAFGDAPFLGSVAGLGLAAPVISITATPSGQGYWLVAADGGVFAFGDAPFLGSVAGIPLAAPVLDIEANGAGSGYWLVAGDGGVFTFGDTPFFGGARDIGIRSDFAAVTASAHSSTYWILANNGAVVAFDADGPDFVGEALLPATPAPTVGMGAVGPSNWAALRPQGSLTVNTPGAVIENVDVTGQITINAPGVTIRNFRANNIVNSGYASVFEDGEIHGNQNQSADGLTGANYTARRLNIHGVLDGLKAGSNTTIEGSWIHDLVFINQGGGNWTHNDGIQVMSGSNIVIRNNVFEGNRGNAAIFLKPDLGPIDNVLIEGNIIGGGGYTLYSINCCGNGAPSNVTIRNNVFTEEHLFGYAVANPGPGWQWANNTNQAGQPINPGGW